MSNSSPIQWPAGIVGAVSLTYDDALPCHFETAGPALEAAGLRGTFNLILGRPGFRDHWAAWKELAARGHELGNHTVNHPCRSEPPTPRPLHDPGYNLAHYSEKRFRDELELANWMLTQTDGRTERTYANTCHHNSLGSGAEEKSIEPILADYFIAARGERTDRAVDVSHINPQNLGTSGADRRPFAELRDEIQATAAAGQWMIYTIHGVGEGTHKGYIDLEEHRRLVGWLGENRTRIWTAPMIEVAKYLVRRKKSRES
jgi:peptidoglycan-N-acetylglucosamine deacetylase